MISGGFAGGGESSSARKAHLCNIRSGEALEIQAVSKLLWLDTTITFSDSDMEGCQHPHDDPLVIRVVIANKTVHRVLVDNGSSINIIFASTFDKMGIGREKLKLTNAHLWGFSRERVLPLGSIQLVLTLGDPPCKATIVVRFLIVDAPSAYNILLGRPSLNAIRAILLPIIWLSNSPLRMGVGMVRGNQRIARECYSASMKQRAVESIYMDELDIRDEVGIRPTPSEELELIQLDDQPEHLVYIGSRFAKDVRDLLVHFLKQNIYVFAWKPEDIGEINPAVITHKLNIIPSFKPIKQKRRSFAQKGKRRSMKRLTNSSKPSYPRSRIP